MVETRWDLVGQALMRALVIEHVLDFSARVSGAGEYRDRLVDLVIAQGIALEVDRCHLCRQMSNGLCLFFTPVFLNAGL